MSMFNDKSLKGVAEAVSKIVDEELKGNQHKIDANKNGKVDAHDFKLLRAKKTMKEDEQLDELSKATVKSYVMKKMEQPTATKKDVKGMTNAYNRLKGYKPTSEEVELDEAFPTVADAKKRMDAGKTATGSVTKTKTGLVHKRDYKDDDTDDADDTQKKSKGYGARQNFKRSTRVNEQLSFTEMLHLYNESGVEVISKIVPQTVKFGDTEVELIDANIVNGAVGITVAEEVDNETFTKEVEAQKEKNAGRGKKAEVAKASVQAVKQEEVEQIDELSKSTLGSYIKKAQSKQINDYQDQADNSGYGEHPERRKGLGRSQNIHRAVDKLASKKTNEETEQINEISKKTLGSYIKAASHDVAAKGAFTRHFADKSRAETAEQKHDIARKTMKKADKMQDAGMKRRANMAKAVDRLTKEDVEQIDERTLTSGETAKKEDYVKGMKKSVSGFKARYGDKAKSVMYATATKMAKKD